MAIMFECNKCGYRRLVPDKYFGKTARCPKCGELVYIKDASRKGRGEPISAALPSELEEAAPAAPVTEQQQEQETLQPGTKRCPFCAEIINVRARKCRFCGEIIDRELAIAKKRERYRDISRRRRAYRPTESSNAKNAMICGIIGLFCAQIILGPIALILGITAHSELKRNPGMQGAGMATAGIVLGIVDIIIGIIAIIMVTSRGGF